MSVMSPFICPICFSKYSSDREPATFTCKHSCCLEHARTMKECYSCKLPIDGVSNLRPDYDLRDASVRHTLKEKDFDYPTSPQANENTRRSLDSLDVHEVCALLDSLSMGDYKESFEKNHITGAVLCACENNEDIKECGVTMNIKAKALLNKVHEFQAFGVPSNLIARSAPRARPPPDIVLPAQSAPPTNPSLKQIANVEYEKSLTLNIPRVMQPDSQPAKPTVIRPTSEPVAPPAAQYDEPTVWRSASQPIAPPVQSAEPTVLRPASQPIAVQQPAEPPALRPAPIAQPLEPPQRDMPATVQYHTSIYEKSKKLFSKESRWSCCKEKDSNHPGCRRGPVAKHHPKLWDGFLYPCCACGERRGDGCQVGNCRIKK